LRIISSRNIYMYGGGFYSLFQDYEDDCAKFGKTCQDKIIETDRSEGIWLYNSFTVGAKEVISPQGLKVVLASTTSTASLPPHLLGHYFAYQETMVYSSNFAFFFRFY